MEEYDVVIVGGCFAGLTLAKHLPTSLKILVLEAKPTVGATVESTGLITSNTRTQFASFLPIDKFITNPISSICVVAPNFKNSFFSSTDNPWIYQTDTKALVAAMAHDLPPNVTLRTSTVFVTVTGEEEKKIISLIGSGKKYEVCARFLVGADGAKSQVATASELEQNKQFLYGYERVYFGDVLLGDNPGETIYHFWFGKFSLGYGGWLSPTIINGRPGIRLGLAKLMKDRGDAGKLTDLFVAKLIEEKIIKITDEPPSYVFGSLIPIGGALKNTYRDNVLLLGNAAGFCGAFAADGIKGAIIAGKEAAPLIAKHLTAREKFSLSAFSRNVNRHDWLLDYYHRQVRYRWAWNMMKHDRTFAALWSVVQKEKESFLHQFCDSKDRRRSLIWTVVKLNNIPRLTKFAFYLILDIFS